MAIDPVIRFTALLDRGSSDTGCWIWQGPQNSVGYGQFWAHGLDGRYRNRLVHRWAHERFVGEIPAGMVIDHLCRTRLCVNPDHLEAVTQRENIRRGASWAGVAMREDVCSSGHALTPDNVYIAPSKPNKRTCRACRAEWKSKRRAQGFAA